MERNLAAVQLLAELRSSGREPSELELAQLAQFTSWGAVPRVFDEQADEHAAVRAQLRDLVGEDGVRHARETVLNAHFTDPAYASSMWRAIAELGWTPEHGPVLEPGCGSGIFIGSAPAGTHVVGVEVDPTTAAIAAALNPAAEIRAESFAESRFPAGRFAAAIGNVPFGDHALFDPLDNPQRSLSIHNHFVIKALRNTAPGGVVALISSRYLLDAKNPAARRQMAELADLVGAVRLPSGAHRKLAGTDVVTDVLLFQRRVDGAELPEEPPRWLETVDVDVDGAKVPVNRYFVDNEWLVEGRYAYDPFPGHGLLVLSDAAPEDIAASFNRKLLTVVRIARNKGVSVPAELDLSPRTDAARRVARAPGAGQTWDGHIAIAGDGFTLQQLGVPEPMAVPKSAAVELRALLQMRDLAREVLDEESASLEDTAELSALRSQLASAYAAYVEKFGPINRFAESVSVRADRKTGEEKQVVTRRVPTAIRLLRQDPFSALVRGLELFDEASRTATPADLLHGRVIEPRQPVLGTEDPGEALAICMDRVGRVDLGLLAELLGPLLTIVS